MVFAARPVKVPELVENAAYCGLDIVGLVESLTTYFLAPDCAAQDIRSEVSVAAPTDRSAGAFHR